MITAEKNRHFVWKGRTKKGGRGRQRTIARERCQLIATTIQRTLRKL